MIFGVFPTGLWYIRYQLKKARMPIGSYDLRIAAQGLAGEYTVVTHNTGEFARVPNLKVVDWVGVKGIAQSD